MVTEASLVGPAKIIVLHAKTPVDRRSASVAKERQGNLDNAIGREKPRKEKRGKLQVRSGALHL
jgi:hypothetical protein